MKKIVSLLISVSLVLSSMIFVSASNEEIKVYLEGYKINFDVNPQTINGRTMVPIRAIFEAMGANVTWDESTQSAISTKDNTTVKMTLNSTTEYINGVAHEMDVTPVIIDSRTLAPARYVAEAFGYYVNWDAMTKSVLISKSKTFDISQIKDGTRQHPYKFGDTVVITVYKYDDDYSKRVPSKKISLTLNSLVNFKQIKSENKSNKTYYLYDDDDWFLTGEIILLESNESEAYTFSDLRYDSKAVTNELSTVDTYSWESDPIEYRNLSLYAGGKDKVYIHIDPENLTEGQTFDYFTISYSSGSTYKDTTTIWFSLK